MNEGEGSPKTMSMQQAFEEMRASWFTTLAVLLLRSENLETVITPEEALKAQELVISKDDVEGGGIKFSAYIREK